MKVLVIGAGGREHAIAWKFAQEARIDRVYIAPGNGGTALEDKCENIALSGDLEDENTQRTLIETAKRINADLTVIGPEAPLGTGIVDRFRDAGLAVIGPDRAASRLETSKRYAKSFMERYGVTTGRSRAFTAYEAASHYARRHFKDPAETAEGERYLWAESGRKPALEAPPLVVKADGLAAGKGVVVASTLDEAEAALSAFMREGSLGEAGKTVLLEEFLSGREVSVLAAVSVRRGKPSCIVPFVSARDHKRRFEGGKGPNTGGMGAIAPAPDFDGAARQDFAAHILAPTLRGMEQEGFDYRGFVFFGLMIREDRCFLLEYNVRLGDPETQAVLPLMDSSLGDLCFAMLENELGAFPLAWKGGAVCAPVAVAGSSGDFPGYPGPYRKGDPIAVDAERLARSGARLFAAGTGSRDGALTTSGGRVLAVSAWGEDAREARRRAYEGMDAVSFEGMAFRRDIGAE